MPHKQKRTTKAKAKRATDTRLSYTFAVMGPRMSGTGTVKARTDAEAMAKIRTAFPECLSVSVKVNP